MTYREPFAALIAGALLITACTSGGSGESTSTTSTPDVTTSTSVGNETTSSAASGGTALPGADRAVKDIDCDSAIDEPAIVCEAYDLIKTMYVDDIGDDTLAEAATQGLDLLDGADSDALLVCAAPAEAFTATCGVAGKTADNSAEAAETMVVGMASFALDPNSGYFDAAALDLLQEEQRGEIEGIGALVSPEDQTIAGDNKQCGVISETCEILIVSTIDGAPAETVGLMRDDKIIAVDAEPILGWTVDEVTATVRGPSGTDVTLTIERDGEELEVTITRAAVLIPVIEDEIFGDVGYVRLWNFTGTASSQFEEAIAGLLADGVDEIVVDLRNNPGGFLTTAIDVTSVFLADGDVVTTQGPEGTTTYPVNGNAIVPEDMSVTFVVNKGSASASEVVSATLQERGRAEVVGENTFGKNTVQQRFSLSNGGALKLTIARWLTPGGLDFGGTGVTPDETIDDVSGLTAAELVDVVTGT